MNNTFLKENKAVDFEDMINESARILKEVKDMKQKLDFKYIIVDEYQDISRQRFDLTKALSEVTDAKIIAVGDDWQSIYAFNILVDVLKGINNKKIFENQLHLVTEFGVLKDLPHETVVSVIDWMISEHLILKTKGKYPVLHSTYEGLHYSEKVTVSKLKRLKKYLEEEVILWNQ